MGQLDGQTTEAVQGVLIGEINTFHDPPLPFEPTDGLRRLTESVSISGPQHERRRAYD